MITRRTDSHPTDPRRDMNNPLVAISQFRRDTPGRRVAARVHALHLLLVSLLPETMRLEGEPWMSRKHCWIFQVETPSGARFSHRPFEGRVCTNDVIFAAAGFADVFGLDWFQLEKWIWTGDETTPLGPVKAS